MADTTILKADGANAPRGEAKPALRRDCETAAHVVAGRAEPTIEGQTAPLSPGGSRVVPRGGEPSHRVPEAQTAVAAARPPCQVHGRDAG